MRANEFDNKFDNNEDVSAELDLSRARRGGLTPKRVNVDIPTRIVDSLDREAARIGVSRQAIIKLWLSERLEKMKA